MSQKKATKPNKFEWSVEKPVKIDKWDGAAVKNALDDAVKNVMVEQLGCVQSHKLLNGRLLLCTIAVLFALYALAWDYFFPFPDSRPVLVICVLSYFVFMGILTIYTMYVEKGQFLVVHEKDKAGVDPDNIWSFMSTIKRYTDTYELVAAFRDGKTNRSRSLSKKTSFAQFIDVDGYICNDLFEVELKKLLNNLSSEKKIN